MSTAARPAWIFEESESGYDPEVWLPFETTASVRLEDAHQRGEDHLDFQTSTNTYTVNLREQIQTNKATGRVRRIRRVLVDAAEQAKLPNARREYHSLVTCQTLYTLARYLFTGDYWGKQCQIIGTLDCLTVGRGGTHANLILEGTDNQDMLKWAEGLIQTGYPPEIAVHLCPTNCPKAPVSTGGLHGQTVSREDKGVAWYGNVASIPRENSPGELAKELSNLSKGGEGLSGLTPPGPLPPPHGTSVEDDGNRKTGGTTFRGTPLDKGTTVRWWLKTRGKKKTKKKRKSKKSKKSRRKSSSNSHSSSSSSSSSTEGSVNSQDSSHPFREGPRIKQLARRVPGILTRHAIEEVERLLAQGVGDNQTVGLVPVMLRYLRLHVLRRDVAPGPKRELLTLAYTIDRLLQRDVLGALDIIMQRVKSLELVVGGSSWAVAQNLELVPLEQEKIASIAEAHAAAKEFKQDARVQRELGKGKGKWTEDWKGGHKGKKGEGKDGKGGKKGQFWKEHAAPRVEPTKLTGSAFEDYPFSSVLLGGELLKLLLGRGCGFGDAVSNFCETSPIETAEGRVKKECNIFPLPLPSNNDLEQMRARGDQKGIWLFIVVCSLNYLNGGIHVQMFSGPPSKVQSRILDYLRERVDVFLGHEFKIIRFDWSRFLQTRSVNYSGEEVRTAKWTSWGHVKPALPYGAIGSVRATEFAEGVVLNLLRNPKPHLLSGWEDMNVKSSRVMVRDEDWGDLARGLVEYGVCCIIPSSAVATCNGRRLHNGVFGVEKNEDVDGVPVHRLIMNLIPLNSISHPVAGSVCTLPLLHQMSALQLHVDEELIVSSEDIRCMFYIFSLPETWFPFLTFGKPVPEDLVPPHCTEECFLAARVLPMGYLNSVGIAQHLHRNIIRNAVGSPQNFPSGSEIRRDRPWSLSNPLWRVYLDNLDQLKKVNHHEVGVLEGKLSTEMSPLVAAYADRGIPLNEKKSVKQAVEAEMQGADLDGSEGFARPRGEKLGKYCSAAVSLVRRRRCSQKEIQVVGGGLVYFCMFRRPLMSSLNSIWRFIQSFEEAGPRVRDIPSSVLSELLMFLGLLPLAHLDLRAPLSGLVTASDASLLGGGVCCSEKVTTLGKKVAESSFRGQGPEVPEKGIVCVGLFDGIGALRVALEALGANVTLHVSVEASEAAKRVVESNFSDVVHVNGVDEVTLEMCQEWSRKCSSCSLVIVGAGLPCPLGSHMNFEEDETAEDPRSGLHRCVLPIVSMLGKAFDWCEVRFIQECIASVDREVKISYTRAADVIPYELCASQLSPCRRCRLYWFDWTLESAEGVKLYPPSCGDASGHGKVDFEIATTFKGCFEKGWDKHPDSKCLSAFTTSQPSASPRSRPAGIHKCDDATRARWMSDRHRFPPYQYKETNLLWNKGKCRIPNVSERERCLGFPVGYTLHAVDKATIKSTPLHAEDVQMTLLGSTWSIPIVAFLLLQLLQPRNLCLVQTLSELLNGLFADEPVLGSSLLTWRGLDPQACSDDQDLSILLNSKLLTLMSAKGADVMIQASHGSRNFQRFRTSVPANLWSWRTVCGFPWAPGEGDHINRLELRAVYTALRWRVLRRNNIRCRLLHLTDSMVCLHVLSRGRSSSRKIQSLMFRVSSLLLAAGLQTYVAYVSSATNPADRPSRHLRVKRKWPGSRQRPGTGLASCRMALVAPLLRATAELVAIRRPRDFRGGSFSGRLVAVAVSLSELWGTSTSSPADLSPLQTSLGMPALFDGSAR
ncbi:Tnks2, partial [Symbiodinium microadriaticum]